MIDPLSLLDGLFADLAEDTDPALPTQLPTSAIEQHIDVAHISHFSHNSHAANAGPGIFSDLGKNDGDFLSRMSRVTSSHVDGMGSAGIVGTGQKTPAETTSLSFPLDLKNVGRVGSEGGVCGPSSLDLTRTAPQRSDWWTGPAMSEADRTTPPAGEPLPVSPTDVRAGVARELRALAEDGREGPDVLRDAVEITRAKIRNSEALAERQAHAGRCHACDAPLDDATPVVAVLSWSRGGVLHLHAACHDVYRARRVALVDRIMEAAGYGSGETR